MQVKTAWIKPPTKTGGLDHIGIQQIPIRIFSTLLPGLTVVTDRVSNYSFYPWVAWAFDEDKGQLGLDFVATLRRADCLLTLIAERHAQVGQEDVKLHSKGLVGRNTLAPVLRDATARPIPLGQLAALRSDNPESYFQNRYGGLGQYYLGPLRELDVLQRVGEKVELSTDVGAPLARAFDGRVDRKSFLRVLKAGVVGERDLDRLASFCPCQLSAHEPERELLIDLLFGRKAKLDQTDEPRRQTLLLLLDLASHRDGSGGAPLDVAFRAGCLTGALDDGSKWESPEAWSRVRRAWATYERNDELAIAVLGIFWVALRMLDDQGGAAQSVGEVSRLVSKITREALGKRAAVKVHEAVAETAKVLPAIEDWHDPSHEFSRSRDVWSSGREGEIPDCVRASVETLLALVARHAEQHPYQAVGIPSDYLSEYPLNLSSFHQSATSEWQALTVGDWIGTLAAEWGIEAHLRVALRKLHRESLDTFLLYVSDDGIRRRRDAEPPRPSFTASRLNRAVQFLVDLGLATWEPPTATGDGGDADYSGDWVARISASGRQLREELGG